MKILCNISLDSHGDPRIKLTKDCPQITFDVYTQDLNLLKAISEIDREDDLVYLIVPDNLTK